jgi:hypothetical protein
MKKPQFAGGNIPVERQAQIKSVTARIDDILKHDLNSDIERFLVAAVLGVTLQRRLYEQGISLLLETISGAMPGAENSEEKTAEAELAERFGHFVGKTGSA